VLWHRTKACAWGIGSCAQEQYPEASVGRPTPFRSLYGLLYAIGDSSGLIGRKLRTISTELGELSYFQPPLPQVFRWLFLVVYGAAMQRAERLGDWHFKYGRLLQYFRCHEGPNRTFEQCHSTRSSQSWKQASTRHPAWKQKSDP